MKLLCSYYTGEIKGLSTQMNILVRDIEALEKEFNSTHTPVLAYCRKLVKEGIDPNTQLHILRDGKLSVMVSNIYAAAKLTVKEKPYCRFIKYKGPPEIKGVQNTIGPPL